MRMLAVQRYCEKTDRLLSDISKRKHVNYFLMLCVFIVVVAIYMINIKFKKDYAVIISSTYYKTSKTYQPNTMALLLNAHNRYDRRQIFHCHSRNATSELRSVAQTRWAYKIVAICKWTTYLTLCPVVQNPTNFELYRPKQPNMALEMPYRHAHTEMTPVVTCFSPLFFNENWQLLLTIIHVYRHFGVSLQAIYVQSMVSRLFKVLRKYADRGVVVIEHWPTIDFDAKDIEDLGYDPNHELDWRNQATAHTDCMLKYRESADFIIVGDIDDVLIPRFGTSYLSEFELLSRLHRNAAGFTYDRFNAELNAAGSPSRFSIQSVLESTLIFDEWEDGKYVVDTRKVESLWLHWPGIVANDSKIYQVNQETNLMLHFRKWNIRKTVNAFVDTDALKNLKFKFTDIVSKEVVNEISSAMDDFKNDENFERLPVRNVYSKLIAQCYYDIFYGKSRVPGRCPGPNRCGLPRIPGVECFVSRGSFKAHQIGPSSVFYYSTKSRFIESFDGCYI